MADTLQPPSPWTVSAEHPRPRSSLRRDKPQLSCTLWKRRKVRCDRQTPCSTCCRRGLARSCVYNSDVAEDLLPKSAGSVHERIHQLESLVVNLMQQNPAISPSEFAADVLTFAPPQGSNEREGVGSGSTIALTSIANPDTALTAESDSGYIKFTEKGAATYVSSSHWAAILDSIADLKDQVEQEEAFQNMSAVFETPAPAQSNLPLLLYGCQTATESEILASVPPRQTADRLVSRYFTLDIAPGILHSQQFLGQYERFWKDPISMPIAWVGLLFSILCLGGIQRHYPTINDPSTFNHEIPKSINELREQTVQCLMLDKYTKGGQFVLETFLQYCMIEHFLCPDAGFQIWILLGMLKPIVFRMGLHRDPKHFPRLSPFVGEMRRRLWATFFQLDIGFSSLAGLPRMITPRQCDTENPLNILDSDFDENTHQLPLSRPESEVTPMLFLLAKTRLMSIGGLISDQFHDTTSCLDIELTTFDNLLRDTREYLPPSLQSRPLSLSIMDDPRVILQRAYLDMFFLKMRITLHKKYLSVSKARFPYDHTREVCLDSAFKILEYHHSIDEESQDGGRLSAVRWAFASLFNHDFMLAASVLCYHIKQSTPAKEEDDMDHDTLTKIRAMLEKSHDIWARSSAVSNEAQKAVQSLSIILAAPQDVEIIENISSHSWDLFAESDWPAFQDDFWQTGLFSTQL